MKRARARWTVAYTACALVVAAAMGVVTVALLSMETRVRVQSAREEAVRLGMWRMESALASWFARESSRPYFHYAAFYAADGAYNEMFLPVRPGAVRVPSPLLAAPPEFVKLPFQFGSAGVMTSPRVPEGNERDVAESGYVDASEVIEAEGLLSRLRSIASPPLLEQCVAAAAPAAESVYQARGVEPPTPQSVQTFQLQIEPPTNDAAMQKSRDTLESAQRWAAAESAKQSINNAPLLKSGANLPAPDGAVGPTRAQETIVQGPFVPVWIDTTGKAIADELVLVRQVRLGGVSLYQGLWMDWQMLRQSLLSRVTDLLPHAGLSPTRSPYDGAGGPPSSRSLAAIPAVLVPGFIPAAPGPTFTPTRITLAVAWLAVIGAVLAGGVVVRGLEDLGERRGRFVSAVTHELRTPLTTFRLYADMLASGLVSDDRSKREYLATLQRESERLAGVVESVLWYARLADLRGKRAAARYDAAELLGELAPALAAACEKHGAQLVTDLDAATGVNVDIDRDTLHRVLTNLVDNAVKYGSVNGDNRVHLNTEGSHDGRRLDLIVADHGRGIARPERARVFRAFERGRREAATDAPTSAGLGLGLALARGLAREMGGDLRLIDRDGFGAAFRLSLPASAADSAGGHRGGEVTA